MLSAPARTRLRALNRPAALRSRVEAAQRTPAPPPQHGPTVQTGRRAMTPNSVPQPTAAHEPPGAGPATSTTDGPPDAGSAACPWSALARAGAPEPAAWLEAWQRQAAQGAMLWAEAIALGARELQQARGIEDLALVPSRMAERLFEVGLRLGRDTLQRLADGRADWLDGLRAQASAAASTAGQESAAGGVPVLMQPWARTIEFWQALAPAGEAAAGDARS